MKKIYVLTIEYDTDADRVEYIQEELIDGSPHSIEYGVADLEEYFDDECLKFVEESYIIGES